MEITSDFVFKKLLKDIQSSNLTISLPVIKSHFNSFLVLTFNREIWIQRKEIQQQKSLFQLETSNLLENSLIALEST